MGACWLKWRQEMKYSTLHREAVNCPRLINETNTAYNSEVRDTKKRRIREGKTRRESSSKFLRKVRARSDSGMAAISHGLGVSWERSWVTRVLGVQK